MSDVPSAPLNAVLRRSRQPAEIDPAGEYSQVTVRLHHQGVVERQRRAGSAFGSGRQFLARAGQLIVSRIDARNGAVGLIPTDLDGALVTADFLLFDVDQDKVNPRYLDYFTSTAFFVSACQRASSGTTNRVRLDPERFADIPLPLPPLDLQEATVKAMDAITDAVDEARLLREQSITDRELLKQSAYRHAFSSSHGWPEVDLEAACTTIVDSLHSNPAYADDGIPCVRSSDVGYGS